MNSSDPTPGARGPPPWRSGRAAAGQSACSPTNYWSVAGDSDDEINATYLQPFLSYTTPDAWTFSLNTESTYNWETDEWSVPVNATVAKLVRVGGKLPVSVFGGVRYWADSPEDAGPTGWGARFGFTVLLPKK